jgi:hypothetical protein
MFIIELKTIAPMGAKAASKSTVRSSMLAATTTAELVQTTLMDQS